MTRQMPESVSHTSVSQFLTSASILPWFCWGYLEQTSELFLVWGASTFCPKTTTGSSQSRTPILPLLFSPPPTSQGCLLPQTKTSALQYTSSKKAPSHHSFLSILVFFLFGSLRLRLWEEASSCTSSITGTEPLLIFKFKLLLFFIIIQVPLKIKIIPCAI